MSCGKLVKGCGHMTSTLATEGPTELKSSHVKEIGCKESVDSC